MIAHMGMYDLPSENSALWNGIRQHLGFGPKHLTQSDDFWAVWTDPALLLSQTCGYPFRAKLFDRVQLAGTPDYGIPGCPPGYYHSVFIRRRGDTRSDLTEFSGARFAYNEALSQSGWAAPIHHLQKRDILPGPLVKTGGHAQSLRAVLDGKADFAALDAVTWRLLQHNTNMPHTSQICEIETTDPTPGLPFITSLDCDASTVFKAAKAAIAQLDPAPAAKLGIKDLIQIRPEDYLSVPTPPSPDELTSNQSN